jgi:hypothetical protein
MYNPCGSIAAVLISNTVIQDQADKDWRFWFLLCARYWREAAIKCPIMLQIAKASLSFAMSRSRVTGAEARKLMAQIESDPLRSATADVTTTAIFDFHQALAASGDFRVADLARKFDELTMFDDVISDEMIASESTLSRRN